MSWLIGRREASPEMDALSFVFVDFKTNDRRMAKLLADILGS